MNLFLFTEFTINGTYKKDTLSFGNYTNIQIGTVDLDDEADTISIGTDSELNITEKLSVGDESNTLSIRTRTTANIASIEGTFSKITLSNGSSEDERTSLNAASSTILGVEGNSNTISVGNYALMDVSAITLGSGNDKVSVGSNSVLTAGSIALQGGTNTMTIGKHSEATVNGDVTGVTTLTLSAGTKDKSGIIDATKLNVTGKIIGTKGKNNTLTLGNYSEAKVGNITFDTGKDKISVGTETEFIAGNIDFGTYVVS